MTLLFIIPHSYRTKDDAPKDLGFYLPGEKMIGTTTREFEDSTRRNWIGTGLRPVRIIIWYPSDKGGEKEIIDDGGTKVTFLKDGKIASQSSKYPLILIRM